MPPDPLRQQVAETALRAAAPHGFALGGGNALIAHGVTSRPTQDVDLFTNNETGVSTAAGAVETALLAAGYQPERGDLAGGLAEVFEGMGEDPAEWVITAPDGAQMVLQLAYFDRSADPGPWTSARCWICRILQRGSSDHLQGHRLRCRGQEHLQSRYCRRSSP